MKCLEPGTLFRPPAVTALAFTCAPNSTTATKLLPLVPYHFLVPGYARAPKDASDPQRAEANITGVLGLLSSNCWTMLPSLRWKRLMSPHGVCHWPKSAVSLSTAADSDSSRSCGVDFAFM